MGKKSSGSPASKGCIQSIWQTVASEVLQWLISGLMLSSINNHNSGTGGTCSKFAHNTNWGSSQYAGGGAQYSTDLNRLQNWFDKSLLRFSKGKMPVPATRLDWPHAAGPTGCWQSRKQFWQQRAEALGEQQVKNKSAVCLCDRAIKPHTGL